MAKRTAVIDIGSNSARLVIFQKTSRYGFHLLCQHKSRVRIGEGAYQREGYLQPLPMERAFQTLASFKTILDDYRVHKTLCVATSALRDAPNRDAFIHRVYKEIGIHIRVIDGESEAQFGALAASNLLPIDDAITIDIGGGSSDMARIVKGRIVEKVSLNLGTVRIKELFTHTTIDIEKAQRYIDAELERLPKRFISKLAVGIGGSARAFAKGFMATHAYPFDKLHAFTYRVEEAIPYLNTIIHSTIPGLKHTTIKANRYDTIREGMLIFEMILNRIGAKEVITSGVGVREGVYLATLLPKGNPYFPKGINPSVQSIRDRLDLLDLPLGNKKKLAQKLFELFAAKFKGDKHDLKMIHYALALSDIGKMLTIYKEHEHAFYVAMHELNYDFTHEEMLLIAMLLRSRGKKYHKQSYKKYRQLLPKKSKIKWLIFLYTLVLILHENSAKARIEFLLDHETLRIEGEGITYLMKEQIKDLFLPEKLVIKM